MSSSMELPSLPSSIDQYLTTVRDCKSPSAIQTATKGYKEFEFKLREVYAQQPDHPATKQNHLVGVFNQNIPPINIRARDLEHESQEIKDQYLLALPEEQRRKDGSPAVVASLADFRTNFNLFSESALMDMDWSNVVAAGSSVVTALLPVDKPHNTSKRALRSYYHETLAPASDVDLFLYGMTEEQATEKIKQIETSVRNSILSETTTIRTKNAITICSEYPTRHIQVVLRLYKTPSEILTGFDVDCAAVCYDGKQVWAAPRALAAFMTQLNPVDLSRRSPSYENRLSKYSHRGFEAFWPQLDRKRVDPTIFERSFGRVMGLARLLVLEKLPHPNDRDTYLAQRREERGRPPLPWNARFRHQLPGNVKDAQPDDVAEWVEEDDVSNYHTFTIPYGPRYNAKKLEKLLFTKDLLLNAEWNKSKDRETKLHRHPAFFGGVEDVIGDCCGFCPKPETDDDLAVAEEENKIYISGPVTFLKDDPGRQQIGSFNPLTEDDWTEMAYIGNTARLCQAIVDKDLEAVMDWFSGGELETVDVNRRDHAGRTPLQLATMCSTPEIVQYLIDHDARIVARIYNGFTALHIAAFRGQTEMVKSLLERSEANQEVEEEKEEARRETRRTAAKGEDAKKITEIDSDYDEDADDGEDITDSDDELSDEMTEGSFVKLSEQNAMAEGDNKDEPDCFDVDVLAWDSPLSPLHLAIIAGRIAVVELLVQEYSADVLLPVKILSEYDRSPESAILTLVLALEQPLSEARKMIDGLLTNGATATQADLREVSALHHVVNSGKLVVLDAMKRRTRSEVLTKLVNHVTVDKHGYYNKDCNAPILTAIRLRRPDLVEALISMGAKTDISLEDFATAYKTADEHGSKDPENVKKMFQKSVDQPITLAVRMEMPDLALRLLDAGADVNTVPKSAYLALEGYNWRGEKKSLLEMVQARIKSLQDSIKPAEPREKPEAPEALREDAQYLDYPKDSYKYWFALHDLEQAKEAKSYQLKQYEDGVRDTDRSLEPAEGDEEKRAAVQNVIRDMEQVEQKLKAAGAKTFQELFPDAPKDQDQSHNHYNHRGFDANVNNSPYSTTFAFTDPHRGYTETEGSRKEAHLKLFEAAWTGDIELVKSLCLNNAQPLRIAVQDMAGFSPWSIAVVRGHKDLADIILNIATIQYSPQKDEVKYRYRLAAKNDSDDDDAAGDSENDEPRVLKDLVSDKFTVNDVTALADASKSSVSPMEMLTWAPELWRLYSGNSEHAKRAFVLHKPNYHAYVHPRTNESWAWFHQVLPQVRRRCMTSLVRYAIVKNDKALLQYVVKVATDLLASKEDDDASKVYNISSADFDIALKLGRTELVGEIIKTTGAGIPLDTMAKTSGVKLEEKPKYYQGLTVYGKKRQDWAERGRGRKAEIIESDDAPVLRAIVRGGVEIAEYYFSDGPLNRYKEFAHTFKDDKRIASLSQVKGGIDKALARWLNTRSELALHAAVMRKPEKDGSMPVLEYVLKTMPDAIDTKAADGYTPLLLAFDLSRVSAAKMLIKAGANQCARTDAGENALGIVLTNHDFHDSLLLTEILKLFQQNLIQPLLLEKSSTPEPGAMTPLAGFINTCGHNPKVQSLLEIILRYSEGKDLEVLDGAGDYILHKLVRDSNEKLVKFIVDYKPEMLHYENATGMTALDVAETHYLRDVFSHPPSIVRTEEYSIKDQSSSTFLPKEATDNEVNEIDALLATDADDLADRNSAWRIHRLLQKLGDKHTGKRKLVSLLDANEIAARLAKKQAKANEETRRRERLGMNAAGLYNQYNNGGGYHNGASADQKQDEVGRWKDEASGAVKWDYLRWERNLKKGNCDKMNVEDDGEWEKKIAGDDD